MRYYITEYTYKDGMVTCTVSMKPRLKKDSATAHVARYNANIMENFRRFSISDESVLNHRLVDSIRYVVAEEIKQG